MLISIDLDTRQRSDRRAGDYVARPVRIVVYPRYTGERRRSIHQRPDYPSRFRIPATRFCSHERGKCECCRRVSRRKRFVVVSFQSPKEPEVASVVLADSWPRSSGDDLCRSSYRAANKDRLHRMEPKILRPTVSARESDDVQASTGDESPWLTEKPEDCGAFVVKPVGLTRIILQLSREEAIGWRRCYRGNGKPAYQEAVASRKNTVIGMNGISSLRLCSRRDQQ